MNNYTVNFTSPETSTDSPIQSTGPLEICVFIIILLFGLPTLFYVIWLIITGTGNGVASEFFILNHFVCEIGNCLLCIFDAMVMWFSCLNIVSNFLRGLAITGRPLFQCLICVERYLAVVYPVTFLRFKPLMCRVICCIVVWILIIGSCLCSMFMLMFSNSTVHMWFFALQFLLFFSIQLFCLVAVLRALKQSGPGERRRERKEENHMKRRAFYIILITTLSIAIIYVPYIIMGFSSILTHRLIKELSTFSYVCYVLAGFVQPVLFLQRAGKLPCFCSP
ncbi:chemokine XC receptor 1-like [Labeo rohita]|uniref:chemokine XC receptor 1-like n=1 Tax=Labeo rohita TaxID=84645 RepID=UPI0021E28EAE|nr:chemokine XC receptor 1-like [Labeo rohita]